MKVSVDFVLFELLCIDYFKWAWANTGVHLPAPLIAGTQQAWCAHLLSALPLFCSLRLWCSTGHWLFCRISVHVRWAELRHCSMGGIQGILRHEWKGSGSKMYLLEGVCSRVLLHDTVPVVSNTVLCTLKFVKTVDLTLHVLTIYSKKQPETQGNSGRCWIYTSPWLWWWYCTCVHKSKNSSNCMR